MQRADRLLQLVMLLRARRSTTAAALAEDLGVSVRTVYRYVRELEDAGVPIEGEAGVGYRLGRGFELPPMVLSADEIEALALGMRMVEQQADAELALAATTLRVRLEQALPAPIRDELGRTMLFAPRILAPPGRSEHLAIVRRAIATGRRLGFEYVDRAEQRSARVVRPLAVYYWGGKWTVAAWCESRADYRNFRPDRMEGPALGDGFPADDPPISVQAFVARQRERDRSS
jgi:predicted DNA-binding transcriptional regulator YafY